MNKCIIIGIFVIISLNLFSQTKIVTGKIFNSNGQELIGASICQDNSYNCAHSDLNGSFCIFLEKEIEQTINIYCSGYYPEKLVNLDTITIPVIIMLKVDSAFFYIQQRMNSRFTFISTFHIDYIPSNFDEFESLLGPHNVAAMNTPNGTVNFEIRGSYKKFNSGFSFGLVFGGGYDSDSLNVMFNETQYGVDFGFNLIDSKRFLATPKIGIKLHRYRLINNNKEWEIPIEQYVSDKDLDIRFNQTIGLVGLNLSYKMYASQFPFLDYWTLGFFGGYIFKLNSKPWIYSERNRLTNNNSINIGNYNLGLNCSFNLN